MSSLGQGGLGGVDFFIDAFRAPPFLLPIYQAAGIEYDVPWQVLAAINEIETDYGRNASVSSAGAVGWMQFLPSTWNAWGLDANGDGAADPANAVDAIFSAARYLHAAGASTNLAGAIFAYNHAWWYVQSVLLRTRLIEGIPDSLTDPLTEIMQGEFPVAAPAQYADDAVPRFAAATDEHGGAPMSIGSRPNGSAVSIFAKQNSPVIAVNDGKIIAIGHNKPLDNYVELQDATGTIYTYARLGSVAQQYPAPKPVDATAALIAQARSRPLPSPATPASAGSQLSLPTVIVATATRESRTAGTVVPASAALTKQLWVPVPMSKQRWFAYPFRPASYAAGGKLQLERTAGQIAGVESYFSPALVASNRYTLKPLLPGATVLAGTILGRLGPGRQTNPPHLEFRIRVGGKNGAQLDPKPILDGWTRLEATGVHRVADLGPAIDRKASDPTVGQVLLMSSDQLATRILHDPHVTVATCGRQSIRASLIDRRILAAVEFLSASGLDPTVRGFGCGHSVSAVGATGSSVDISAVNTVPVAGHQGAESITDLVIRRLLALQGAMKPDEIVSAMSYHGQTNTLVAPHYSDRIRLTYAPLVSVSKEVPKGITSSFHLDQLAQLIDRIGQLPEPTVSIVRSKYAITAITGA